MSVYETQRFRWPVPGWDVGWQQWQPIFQDLINNIEASMFANMEAATVISKLLPEVTIVDIGGGSYVLRPDGPTRLVSRTFQTDIIIPQEDVSLIADSILCVRVQAGAVGEQLTSWESVQNGIEKDPSLLALGYVTDAYSINWFNGATMEAGDTMVLFGGGSGGGGGGIFVASTGALSAVRKSAGNTASGEGSFGMGQNVTVSSDYSAGIGYNLSIQDNSPTQYGIQWPRGLNFAFGKNIEIDSSMAFAVGYGLKTGTPEHPTKISFNWGVNNTQEASSSIPFFTSGEGAVATFGYMNYSGCASLAFGFMNAIFPNSDMSVTMGAMNRTGVFTGYLPFKSTGVDMFSSTARGGSNIADAGNLTGNTEILVKNSVISGNEFPAGFIIIDGDGYFYNRVTDTPSPRFILEGSSTLSRDYDEDSEVLWGSAEGMNLIFCMDNTMWKIPENIPLTIKSGNDYYLSNNHFDIPYGEGNLHVVFTNDRFLDRTYTDGTLVQFGNLKGCRWDYPSFIFVKDPTVFLPTPGIVGIDGDYYTFNSVGYPDPFPKFFAVSDLDRILDRDYPSACDVRTAKQRGVRKTELVSVGGTNTCAAGNLAGSYELLVQNADPYLEADELTVFSGGSIEFSGYYDGMYIWASGVDLTSQVPSTGTITTTTHGTWGYISVVYSGGSTFFQVTASGPIWPSEPCFVASLELTVKEVISDYNINPSGLLEINGEYQVYSDYISHVFTLASAFTVPISEDDVVRVVHGMVPVRVNGVDEYFPAIDFKADPSPRFILDPGGAGLLNNYNLGDSVEYGNYVGLAGVLTRRYNRNTQYGNWLFPCDSQIPPFGHIKIDDEYYHYDGRGIPAPGMSLGFGGKAGLLTVSHGNESIIQTGNLMGSPVIAVLLQDTIETDKPVVRIDGDNYVFDPTGAGTAWPGMVGLDINFAAGETLTRDYPSFAEIEQAYTCGDMNRTARGRGGEHLAAAGNNIGNAVIEVKESVLAGSEAPAGLVSIAGDIYEYSGVADGPPRFILTGTLTANYSEDAIVRFGNMTGSPVVFSKTPVVDLYPPYGILKIDGDYYSYSGLNDSLDGIYTFENINSIEMFVPGLTKDYEDDALIETGNLKFSEYVWVRTEIETLSPSTGYFTIEGDRHRYGERRDVSPGYSYFYVYNGIRLGKDYRSNATFDFDIPLTTSNQADFIYGLNCTNEGLGSACFGQSVSNYGEGNFNAGYYLTNYGDGNASFGQGTYINDGTTYGIFSGYYNNVYDLYCSSVRGSNNYVQTGNHLDVSGYSHNIHNAYESIISGWGNIVQATPGRGYPCNTSAIFGQGNDSYGGESNIIAGSYISNRPVNQFSYSEFQSSFNALFGTNYSFRGSWSIVSGVNHHFPSTSYYAVYRSNVSGIEHTFLGSAYGMLVSGALNTIDDNTQETAIFGNNNRAIGSCALISGTGNTSWGYNAVTGSNNTGWQNSLVGGSYNSADVHSLVSGYSNVGKQYSAVFGYDNTDGSGYSIVGGSYNSNYAPSSIVSGNYNTVQGNSLCSSVSGRNSSVEWPYCIAHSSGSYIAGGGSIGDRLNTVDVPLIVNTTDASWTSMVFTYGVDANCIFFRDNTVYVFDIIVIGTRKSGLGVTGETKSWRLEVTARRSGVTITIDNVNSYVLSDAATLPWDVQVVSYGPTAGNYGIKVQVKGEVGKTIYWQASCRVVEINTTN